MGSGKLMLTAIMAGIYSGILDGVESHYGLNKLVSAFVLILVTFITGYALYRGKRFT
ncbi:hypothetical protein ACQKFO_10020 [Rossellomorea sp. NPDC071047]|uniref:hypothetical protein n=1 Tax=Rossellomorea sp. NPDC071047 TaxID=3390675 RepID=UPI003D088F90